MTTWKVQYCNTPTNHNLPRVLIIEAESMQDACLTALDHLNRLGLDAGISIGFRRSIDARLDHLIGVGHTLIQNIQPYSLKSAGKVIAENAGKDGENG